MTNLVPYKVLGNILVNSEANSNWTTLNAVTEISEIPEWKKSRYIREKIKVTETPDELTQLTEEIKNSDYSEADKTELRKIFKQKKESLKQITL